VHRERDLLARLIGETQDVVADIVVVHDGPDGTGIRQVVEQAGGRFHERPRAYQQEPHWPFAWEQAREDWILRLDADEMPSLELKAWLREFKAAPEPADVVSGFTCIWPVWNGRRQQTRHWPAGRLFLFHRRRVRFFGMVEQCPVPDGRLVPLNLVLEHRPLRKSHGLANVLIRRQAYRWRERIATSLLDTPMELERWRWETAEWPPVWEMVRRQPLRTAVIRLVRDTLVILHDQWRAERRTFPFVAASGPLHHALICIRFAWLRWRRSRRSVRAVSAEAGQDTAR
jgi:hypothetical protein